MVKYMNEDLKQKLDTWKKLQNEIEEIKYDIEDILNKYFRAICASQGRSGHSYYSPDSYVIEEDCVRFFLELNTACHCHPEMKTFEFVLPFALLDMTPDEVQKYLTEQIKIENDRKIKEEAEKKRIASERAKATQLEADKKKYEELKKKFEKE